MVKPFLAYRGCMQFGEHLFRSAIVRALREVHTECLLDHIRLRLHFIQEFGKGLIHFQSPSKAKAHACQCGSSLLASEQAAWSASPSSISVRRYRSITLSKMGKMTL